jgi:aminoglycoside 6'-N-acetyltransferase I
MSVTVRPARDGDQAEWLRMRALLWPGGPAAEHAGEIAAFLGGGSFGWSGPSLPVAVFVAVRPAGGLCGFLEASLRPFADGCGPGPVGYVEGWFVDADVRRTGVGRRLVAAAERWAAAQGCREMASDAHVDNAVSLAAHRAFGFEEAGRSVQLRKWLAGAHGEPAGRGGASPQQTLLVLDGTFAVCRLGGASPVPPWATFGDFLSITRTAEELSVVCPEAAVPEGVKCERGWRCLRVAGTVPFSAVGTLASLASPLAAAGVSLFAVSTFDTDYLLVKGDHLEKAVGALRGAGHVISGGGAV